MELLSLSLICSLLLYLYITLSNNKYIFRNSQDQHLVRLCVNYALVNLTSGQKKEEAAGIYRSSYDTA